MLVALKQCPREYERPFVLLRLLLCTREFFPVFFLNSSKLFSKLRQGKEERTKILKKRAAWREFQCLALVPAYLPGQNFPDANTGDRMPRDIHIKGNALSTNFLPTKNASGRKDGRVSPGGNPQWKKF